MLQTEHGSSQVAFQLSVQEVAQIYMIETSTLPTPRVQMQVHKDPQALMQDPRTEHWIRQWVSV